MANTTGKKYGGRQKGTPNKLTKELRFNLKDILFNELETLEDRLEELEPRVRIELLIKLMPFVFPRINSVHFREDEPFDWG
tara:strand:- start:45 stop:287 length:243 start_codon:yes stop_codon:yes gene_type:complete